MDKEHEEKLEMKEHVPVPERVCIPPRGSGDVWVHSEMSRMFVHAQKRAWQAHTGNCPRRMEEELRGTVEAEAPQRWVKECFYKAAKR